jgi:plasmid stabilization system protein ParE
MSAAGINSIHNACAFRENCRQAEAEIARLRENVAPVISSRASSEQTRRCEWCGEIAQGECGCAAETEIARLLEDAERYRWLRPRIHGFDADVCHGGLGVVFKFPENSRVGIGASLDAAIDAARRDTK